MIGGSPKPTVTRRPVVTLGVLVLGLAAGSWLLWLLVQATVGEVSLEALEGWVEAAGPWAPAASVALMIVHTVVPFPAELLAAANGMLFGAVSGSLLTWLGGLAGAASGYAVGWLFARWLARRLGYAEGLARMRHLVERHGTAGLVAVRLLPVIPFNVVDYAAGMLHLSRWTFAWTTAVGILPWSVLLAVGGTQVIGAMRREAVAMTILVAMAVLLVVTAWVGHRWSRGALSSRRPIATGDAPPLPAGAEAVWLAIPDMACGACARALNRRLSGEPGVRQVRIELEARVIRIAFDQRRTSVGQLTEAIRDAGFTAEARVA